MSYHGIALSAFDPEKVSFLSRGDAEDYVERYGDPTSFKRPAERPEWGFWFWEQAPRGDWPFWCWEWNAACDAYFGERNWASFDLLPPAAKDDEGDALITLKTGLVPDTAPPAEPPRSEPSREAYPWKVESADTRALQKEINSIIVPAGYCAISTDGKLGPGTCGAARMAGLTPPSTCQSFTSPSRCPSGGRTAPPPETFEEPRRANVGMIAGIGIAVVGVAAAIYWFTQKKAA